MIDFSNSGVTINRKKIAMSLLNHYYGKVTINKVTVL